MTRINSIINLNQIILDTRTEVYNVGNLEVKLVCDFYFGDYLATQVIINGQTLCTIEGIRREAFIKELTELVDNYKI